MDDLEQLEQDILWFQQEDLRLRREAETDPELAALLRDADEAYEQRHGKPWANPLAGAA